MHLVFLELACVVRAVQPLELAFAILEIVLPAAFVDALIRVDDLALATAPVVLVATLIRCTAGPNKDAITMAAVGLPGAIILTPISIRVLLDFFTLSLRCR